MPRLNAEEKHRRQLAKMQKQAETPVVVTKPQESPLQIALEAAQKAGFPARLEDCILKFYTTDEEEKKRIREWVAENYNYSWGFPGKDLKHATNGDADREGIRTSYE